MTNEFHPDYTVSMWEHLEECIKWKPSDLGKHYSNRCLKAILKVVTDELLYEEDYEALAEISYTTELWRRLDQG